jgi:hypothetical protein
MQPFLAYIDPGSGSLIIQAIIASLVAIPILFRNQLARAVRTVRRAVSRGERRDGSADDSLGSG